MASLWKSLMGPPLCEHCGLHPKFGGFDYCGKMCAVEAEKKKKAATQMINPTRPPNPVIRRTSTPHRSLSEAPDTSATSNMCTICGIRPKFSGFDYCGKTCAVEAEKKERATTRTSNASRLSNPAVDSTPISHRSSPARNTTASSNMCNNCGVLPKYLGFDYCGKPCAAEAERKKKVITQTTSASRVPHPVVAPTTSPQSSLSAPDTALSLNMCQNCGVRPKVQGYDYCGQTSDCGLIRNASAQGPPKSVAGQGSPSYTSAEQQEFNASATSNLCEHCLARPKSREPDDDGTVITHSYCGIRCYKASQSTLFPASTIPAPAAAFGGQDPLKLRAERANTPVGRKILLMVQERWQSETVRIPQVKGVYRIDLPKEIYRRFDLALQMNDDCVVKTTYYGGIAICSITNDTDPAPCASEFCELCDSLRHSFSNLLQGASCRDGSFGPGLYTYLNPALAHDSMVSEDDSQGHKVNYALIQCRVVTQANNMPTSNSYAGLIDDSGVVFCAQSTAVIPTHVVIYRLSASPNPRHLRTAVNSNSAATDRATPTIPARFSGFGQGNSVATSPPASPGLPTVTPPPLSPSSVPAPPLRSLPPQRGLSNTVATASNAVKQATGGDPQSMAGLPALAPTPAFKSGYGKSMPQAFNQANSATSGSGYASTPALDPATKALHALVMSSTRGSPLNSRSSPPQAPIDDDDALDDLVEEGTSYPNRGLRRREPSTSYVVGANSGGYEKATRGSFYPLTRNTCGPLGGDHDHDLRASAAAARDFMTRSNDLNSRDDDLYFLNPDPGLAKRQEQDEEDEEDLNFLTPDPGLARRPERYDEDEEDLNFLTPDPGLARRPERYDEDEEDLNFLTPDSGLARRQERYDEDEEDLNFLTPDSGLARRQERYDEDEEDLNFLTPDPGLARRQGQDMYI